MRKLAWVSFGFALAVFVSHYLLPEGMFPWAAGGSLLLVFAGLALKGRARRRWILCLTAMAVGFGWYGMAAHRVITPLEALDGKTERVYTARVAGYPTEYDHAVGLALRLRAPGPDRMLVRVYDYDGGCGALQPGDEIRVKLRLRPGTRRYGEETDSYLAQGVCALGTVTAPPEKTGVWKWSALYFPIRLSHHLLEITEAIFPADVRAFAPALMLGEKRMLYQENLDIPLRDAGIMHAVAVSGMHLSFLLGAVTLLIGHRRGRAIACLPLLILFALMAGATPSVLRAGFMAAVFLFAPVLGRENDPPTSLLAALAALLLINPFSAGSASLQLSFGSMAGIVMLTGPIYNALRRRFTPVGKPPRAVHRLYTVLAATLGSMVLTVPLGAVRFGTVTLAAPITNLLVMSVLPAAFALCFVSAALGAVWLPLGRLCAWITAWPLRCVLLVAKGAAAIPGLRYSAANPLTAGWLVLVYLLIGAWVLLRRRGRKLSAAVPLGCVLASLLLLTGITRWQGEAVPRFTALDVSQGQSLFFRAGKTALIVDCGGNHTAVNAGDLAAQALLREGRTRLDALILTHPHEDHVNGAARLLLQCRVAHLFLPAAADPESDALREILVTAERRGTVIHRLTDDTSLALPGLNAELFVALGREEEDGCLMAKISHDDFDVLVTGDVTDDVEARLAAKYDLSGTEVYVAGHHGSRHASGDALLDQLGAQAAVISCGYNSYGHPTEETLDRLARHGLTIKRTDLDGNVTFRME